MYLCVCLRLTSVFSSGACGWKKEVVRAKGLRVKHIRAKVIVDTKKDYILYKQRIYIYVYQKYSYRHIYVIHINVDIDTDHLDN